nr:MAG TPA: hypothetical protein [Bacteriophage sp.]
MICIPNTRRTPRKNIIIIYYLYWENFCISWKNTGTRYFLKTVYKSITS